jgi:hypothetical protein
VLSGPSASRNVAVTDAFTFMSNITGSRPLVAHFPGRRTKRRFHLLRQALAAKVNKPDKKSTLLIF